MFMAMMLRLYDRLCGIDRNDSLQHPEEWIAFTGPLTSIPHVINFESHGDVIEHGARCHRKPRRLKRCNVVQEMAENPGVLAKINRLMRRGYYQAHR